MRRRVFKQSLELTVSLLLVCGEGFAQCGWGIEQSIVQCNSTSGVKQITSYTCQLYGTYMSGNPGEYCSENTAYCQQVDGTEKSYSLANLAPQSSCSSCNGSPGFVCSSGQPRCISNNQWACSDSGATQCELPPLYCPNGTPVCESEGWYCQPRNGSPIIVDTDGSGFHLTSAEGGVAFDIQGDGHAVELAWTARGSRNAFLALDRNHNGEIDNGKELFGNFTEQPPSDNPNGFLALAEFDKPERGGNGDRIMDKRDAVFSHLLLWIDENHDGMSQTNELHALPELGVYSIGLHYRDDRKFYDQYGNWFHYQAPLNPNPLDGTSKDGRITYDVFFVIDQGRSRASNTTGKRTTRTTISPPSGSYRNGELIDGLDLRLRRATFAGTAPVTRVTNQSGERIMKRPTLVVASMCSLVPALCAQQVATSPTVNLKPIIKVELPFNRNFQMDGRTKCDDAGSIYGRPDDNSKGPKEAFVSATRVITPNGEQAEILDLPTAWGDIAGRAGIFVSLDGHAYQAVRYQGVSVVEFAKDGSVRSKTRLATGADVAAQHLAVFKSGRFLLVGETGGDRNTPYAAVFEPDGRLVKKIYEPEDDYAKKQAETGDSEYSHSIGAHVVGNDFTGLGDVTLGDDGNAYLMHGASPTIVYVISPAGDVLRKFRVASSEPGKAAWSIKSYKNRLAFSYQVDDHLEIQVTDLEGNPVAGYTINQKARPDVVDTLDLACYDSNGFTLISTEASSNLYLLRVKP